MKNPTTPGTNRTGLAIHPVQAAQLIAATAETRPSMKGDGEQASELRIQYSREAEPVGTMPPPASAKELARTAWKVLKGQKPAVLLDKLGERLGFERSGTRLYEALLSKFDAFGTWRGGPTRAQLQEIHAEELRHFEMLVELITRLGADPTALTPSANVHAVASEGIFKVVTDPRVDLRHSLEAVMVAELTDNECWENLIALARSLEHDELATRFEEALDNEQRHVRRIRGWLAAAVSQDALGYASELTRHRSGRKSRSRPMANRRVRQRAPPA